MAYTDFTSAFTDYSAFSLKQEKPAQFDQDYSFFPSQDTLGYADAFASVGQDSTHGGNLLGIGNGHELFDAGLDSPLGLSLSSYSQTASDDEGHFTSTESLFSPDSMLSSHASSVATSLPLSASASPQMVLYAPQAVTPAALSLLPSYTTFASLPLPGAVAHSSSEAFGQALFGPAPGSVVSSIVHQDAQPPKKAPPRSSGGSRRRSARQRSVVPSPSKKQDSGGTMSLGPESSRDFGPEKQHTEPPDLYRSFLSGGADSTIKARPVAGRAKLATTASKREPSTSPSFGGGEGEEEDSDVDEDALGPDAKNISRAERKRRLNTISARLSRQRKKEQMSRLEEENKELREEIGRLKGCVGWLEGKCREMGWGV